MSKNKLLVSSRGRFVQTVKGCFFEEGDGFYLEEISSLFDNTTIIAREISVSNIQNETYALNKSITCLRTKTMLKWKFPKLIKYIRDASVVYVFYPLRSSLLIALIAKLFQKKIIAYNGGVWNEMKLLGERQKIKIKIIDIYYRVLELLSVILSGAYIVNNPQLYETYSDRYNMIKASPFLRISKKDLYKRDVTCTSETIEILCVNHVKPGKSIIEIMEAFKMLSANGSGDEYNLTILGKYDPTSGYGRKVYEYLQANNFHGSVTLTGIINDMETILRYYRKADMLILVSESEGFPRVIWEAFSQSLPVICSNLPNIKLEFSEMLSPVFILENNDPNTICRAIEEVSTNNELRKIMIHNGMNCYKEKTSQTPYEQFENILKTLDES